jgi:hypothetical protein
MIDNKDIVIKKDDNTFKQNVIQIFQSNVYLFYSLVTHQYLGYKEKDSKVTIIKNSQHYITIEYSLANKLLLNGASCMYLKVIDDTDLYNLFLTIFNNLRMVISETI